MGWVVSFFWSSIGKKQLMAVTGLSFIGFLCVHLAGNLTVLGGDESFNSYAKHLHSLGILLRFAEAGLILLAAVHITTGVLLFFQNRAARGGGYEVSKSAGGKTWSSSLMPYTGFVLIAFISVHVTTMNVYRSDAADEWELLKIAFNVFGYSPGFFIFPLSLVEVGLHVRHGFWSAFQTFGLNHPKYMPAIRIASVFLALIFSIGFLVVFYLSPFFQLFPVGLWAL